MEGDPVQPRLRCQHRFAPISVDNVFQCQQEYGRPLFKRRIEVTGAMIFSCLQSVDEVLLIASGRWMSIILAHRSLSCRGCQAPFSMARAWCICCRPTGRTWCVSKVTMATVSPAKVMNSTS